MNIETIVRRHPRLDGVQYQHPAMSSNILNASCRSITARIGVSSAEEMSLRSPVVAPNATGRISHRRICKVHVHRRKLNRLCNPLDRQRTANLLKLIIRNARSRQQRRVDDTRCNTVHSDARRSECDTQRLHEASHRILASRLVDDPVGSIED
jgi:hypothetical protein